MVFVRPIFLWLLLLVLPLLAMHRPRRLMLGAGRTAAVALSRTLAFTALVLALARPVIEWNDPRLVSAVVVDLSSSITDADLETARTGLAESVRRRKPHEMLRLVVFAQSAREVPLDDGMLAPGGLARLRIDLNARTATPAEGQQPGSALAEALELAGATIPHDGRGHIVVYTDGLETRGDARTAAWRLAERGIRITCVPVGKGRSNEVLLRSVSLPATAGVGETVRMDAIIESTGRADATLVVRREGDAREQSVPIALREGRQTCSVPCALTTEGLIRYEVRIESPFDTLAENNSLNAAVWVQPPQRVLVVEDDPATPATRALAAFLGNAASVHTLSPSELARPGILDDVACLTVADVPAENIAADAQERIRRSVIDGMGLLVTGGRRSFGPGGYANTPIADVLPVRLPQKIERRDPSTTLVVIIDTSGSMGGPRVNLAKEIARLAIARLKPHDKVGIVEFYGSKRWAAPIQPASNAIDLQRALNRLSASGGTVILPAIEEAYYALQNVRTRTKHVLVLTDGGVESGPFEQIVRKMADSGITLSTVLVGPGTDSAFLASLAQWGRGRFYSAPDRFNLPEVIVKQPESSLLAPFVEQPTSLRRKAHSPILDEIPVESAPPIAGYVETEIRPTADILLESELEHPILANWRFGLGEVAVFTSQLGGEWSGDFSRWAGSAALFSNLVRRLGAPRADNALRIQPLLRTDAVELRIENGMPLAGSGVAPLDLSVTGPAEFAVRQTLDPLRPDLWNARLAGLSAGTYRVTARTSDGRLAGSAAFAVPEVREVTSIGPATELFQDIHNMGPRAEQRAAQRPAVPPRRPIELWPALAIVALSLLLANVAIRRWPSPAAGSIAARALLAGLAVCPPFAGSRIANAATTASQAAASVPTASRPTVLTTRERTISEPPAEAVVAIGDAIRDGDSDGGRRRFADACRITLLRDGRLDALVLWLRRQTPDVGVARWLARAALEQGDLSLARETLASLTAGRDADPQAWAELARAEELSGNDAGALAALERAIAIQREPDSLLALRVRQALILYDRADKVSAGRVIGTVVDDAAGDPSVAKFCAHLAALNGDHETAVALLRPHGDAKTRCHDHLFRGLFLLRLGRPAEAQQEFESAYDTAPLARDRRFAIERIIASAREAGHLKSLADRWLAEPQLAADRLAALVAVLRELGRADDALTLLRRPPQTPEQHELFDSPEFQQEVVAVAVEAGRAAEAEAAYAAMLKQEPGQTEWRVGLARLRLIDGRRNEAAQLFMEAIDRTDETQQLMALAAGARRVALHEAALAAARKAGRKDKAAHVRAVLFEADVLRQQGRTDEALSLLKKLMASVETDMPLLLPLAETFERYGDRAEALRLFRRLYENTRTEDMLLKVAWLLEEEQRFDEAFALWKDMWQTTRTPARLRQSQDRMLALASRTGKLADLAVEMEERLAEGKGGDQELSLLVEIYTRANDPVSAAEIVQDIGRRRGNPVDALKRLVKVYLSCEQFGRCNAVLRRLASLDPENAEDYLQQLAIIALERRQPQQARAALAELQARAGGGSDVDEFSAGVLAMAGMHEEAAEAYGRVLARHPDRIEGLLLWANAMKAAGRNDTAVARFQVLVEDAAEDDLFTVAVDGLLNLNARPAAMRSALRRVCSRIAARPDKVFLYQLAVDLHESLGQPARAGDVMEQAVVVAGERRGPMLRELLDAARTDNRNDRVIRFGRSLIGLGEELPPQVFLDIGEAMIREGDLAMAARVFERAGIGADYSAVQQRVATCYEEAGLPARADRIIRELLISEPENVMLLIRSGGLCEQLGQFDRAFAQYYQAADLMLRRLPGVVRARQSGAGRPRDDGNAAPFSPFRAANVDEIGRYFDVSANGLRSAARSRPLQERLLNILSTRLDEEIASLASSRTLTPTIARHPRLLRLARFYRSVAFALHAPELADAADRRLLKLFPEDANLRSDVVADRAEWGLYSRAAAMATDDNLPIDIRIGILMKDPGRLQALLSKGIIDTATARRLIPLLIMTGREPEARAVLRAVRPHPPQATRAAPPAETDADPLRGPDEGVSAFADTAAFMIVAATALDEPQIVRNWSNAWLDACARMRDGAAIAASLRRCLETVWNRLQADERAALPGRIASLADGLEGTARLHVDLLRMELAEKTGTPFDALDRVLEEAIRDKRIGAHTLAHLLDRAPAADRPGLLTRMVAAREPAAQREFILAVVSNMNEPADARLAETLETLFKAAPRQRSRTDDESAPVAIRSANRRQAGLLRRLAEITLSESPNDPAVLTSVAIARIDAGMPDEAAPLVREAIDTLVSIKKPTYTQGRLLGDLARLLPPDDVAALLAEFDERAEIEGPTAMLLLARALLLDSTGREAEAIAAYRAAFEMQPAERVFVTRLISALKRSGRAVELSRLLAAYLTRSTLMETLEWYTLVTTYCDLFDPVRALQAARKLETLQGPVEAIRISRMMGRDENVCTAFRRLYTSSREAGRSYSFYWSPPATVGGMVSWLTTRGSRTFGRSRLFEALADLPFAEGEFAALLMAAPPGQRDIDGLIDGLLEATRVNRTQSRLVESLLDSHRRDALNVKDRRVVLLWATRDPTAIPDALLPVLDDVLLYADPNDYDHQRTLSSLADIYRARGDLQRARRILKWLVAADGRGGRSSTTGGDRFRHLDDYVALLPESERKPALRRLLDAMEPGPLDTLKDDFDAARLERWATIEDRQAFDRRLEAVRERLETAPATAGGRELISTIARHDAAAGRFDKYVRMVKRFAETVRDETYAAQIADVRTLLPPAKGLADPTRYLDAIVAALAARRSSGDLSGPGFVRGLCLLGEWCVTNSLADRAISLLAQAEQQAGSFGEHWLWIADLARLAGMNDKALAIETRLLEADLLPVPRVPALLDAVEAAAGRAAADRLAIRVATYSDLPVVLQRAMRYASETGDTAAAQAYQARLRAVSPPVPSATAPATRPSASSPVTARGTTAAARMARIQRFFVDAESLLCRPCRSGIV